MSDADRKRLTALLGMLGSSSAGERDNAARQAERLRRRLGKSWNDLVGDHVVYIDRFIPPWPTQPVPPKWFWWVRLGLPEFAFAFWYVALGCLLGVGIAAAVGCH